MSSFYTKNLFNTHFVYVIIISIFSFSINFYYSKFGVFPIDSFLHYDSAFNILNNHFPIKDYWIVSGFVVDFLQSYFFKIFGVNWFAYVFHSSLFNVIATILSYCLFINLKISKLKSLIYCLSFAALAYTISGSPFVDHHAALFLLISSYLIIFALNNPKKIYLWTIVVVLFFLSFLSKQVPATYAVLTQGIILLFIFIKNKDFNIIKTVIISSALLITFFIFLLTYLKIDLNNFLIQYLEYPRTIGSERINKFSLSFESFFNNYKFIILPVLIIAGIKFKKLKDKELNLNSTEIYNFVLFFVFSACLIFNQIMTKNQIYIYFLIPIFFAWLDSDLNKYKFKYRKYFSITIIIALILITLKYHYRYNETRKFHELEYTNLKRAIPAEQIHKSLKGLFWINPFYKDNPINEIVIINKAKKKIEEINFEIMLITNYLFLNSLTNKELNYSSRASTVNGTTMPQKNNKYYSHYQKFLKAKISDKKIKEVYFFKHEDISHLTFTQYFKEKCYEKRVDEIFVIYELKCLK
jgi:hypothetical protein